MVAKAHKMQELKPVQILEVRLRFKNTNFNWFLDQFFSSVFTARHNSFCFHCTFFLLPFVYKRIYLAENAQKVEFN